MKIKIIRIIFLLVSISLIAAQCGNPDSLLYVENSQISRVVDYEAQVVCWVASPNSISCLPISNTSLSREKP